MSDWPKRSGTTSGEPWFINYGCYYARMQLELTWEATLDGITLTFQEGKAFGSDLFWPKEILYMYLSVPALAILKRVNHYCWRHFAIVRLFSFNCMYFFFHPCKHFAFSLANCEKLQLTTFVLTYKICMNGFSLFLSKVWVPFSKKQSQISNFIMRNNKQLGSQTWRKIYSLSWASWSTFSFIGEFYFRF